MANITPIGRVALLVDGDNVGAHHAEYLLECAKSEGRLDIARVYTDVTRSSGWLTAEGYRSVHAGTGKNATDVLLALEGASLAMEQGIKVFLVASSDGDFSHLMHWLRERGCTAIGFGEEKTAHTYRAACSQFNTLPRAQSPAKGQTLDEKIISMIRKHQKNGSGMRVAELAQKMHQVHKVRISLRPERNWRGYLSTRTDLYELDPRGPEARVRIRQG